MFFIIISIINVKIYVNILLKILTTIEKILNSVFYFEKMSKCYYKVVEIISTGGFL